jgi:hypothetical protein
MVAYSKDSVISFLIKYVIQQQKVILARLSSGPWAGMLKVRIADLN